MAQIEYELNRLLPRADAGYSGNPADPSQATCNKAPGRLGAIPPYIIAPNGKGPGGGTPAGAVNSVMPMSVRCVGDAEWYRLPIEPLVSLSGRNAIVRRTAAKSKAAGTVKEYWSRDDYTVTIQGVVSAPDGAGYPAASVRRLLELFGQRQAIEVDQQMLLLFGIRFLAIESIAFPHTRGAANQSYTIQAYSDTTAQLLIKI